MNTFFAWLTDESNSMLENSAEKVKVNSVIYAYENSLGLLLLPCSSFIHTFGTEPRPEAQIYREKVEN